MTPDHVIIDHPSTSPKALKTNSHLHLTYNTRDIQPTELQNLHEILTDPVSTHIPSEPSYPYRSYYTHLQPHPTDISQRTTTSTPSSQHPRYLKHTQSPSTQCPPHRNPPAPQNPPHQNQHISPPPATRLTLSRSRPVSTAPQTHSTTLSGCTLFLYSHWIPTRRRRTVGLIRGDRGGLHLRREVRGVRRWGLGVRGWEGRRVEEWAGLEGVVEVEVEVVVPVAGGEWGLWMMLGGRSVGVVGEVTSRKV